MKKNERDRIVVKGASTHNLKKVDVEIPRNTFTVVTGLSGSGKSSLAFDTIFAEGQRRYVESLSAYARQFLRQMQKPEVEDIRGLSPAISIDQKNRSNNPRSTVATITEIYDYLRVLFARFGTVRCLVCSRQIHRHSQEEIISLIKKEVQGMKGYTKKKKVAGVPIDDARISLYAPVVMGRKGEYYQLLYTLLRKGYQHVRVDGKRYPLHEKIVLSRNKKHTIDVLVDELYVSEYNENKRVFMERLSDAVERALHEADDVIRIVYPNKEERLISAKFYCPYDGFSFPEVEPRLFSFNSPYGACEECNGLGLVDMFIEKKCEKCDGKRLRKEALSVFIGKGKNEKNIIDVINLSVEDCNLFFIDTLFKKEVSEKVAAPLLHEIRSRLSFMSNVGLNYLTLTRRANTLSGGEAQRIRLASQLGSRLVGALYVLDEPTIGLHARDNDRLIKTLTHLRDLGNTIIVVEHDEETVLSGDYLIDVGPGAGIHGGTIVASGYLDDLLKSKKCAKNSLTLQYLRGEKEIEVPLKRRTPHGHIRIKGGKANNIKNLTVKIPLNSFVVITGVSGSGKSTLLYDILHKNLLGKLEHRFRTVQVHNAKEFEGTDTLSRVVMVDQSPIGRTPRSTPITYIGAMTHIRDLFAATEEARLRGWKPGRFSFNVRGGRCEKCDGNGVISVEMHFLPTVYVTCDLCRGRRFTKEVLDVRYRGKNIYDVLSMSVEEAEAFFKDIPAVYDRLSTLTQVGLHYLVLGQSSTTLSGGEAQRIKIASELYRPNTRRTIYLLDEPTVGLHYEDVNKLIAILNKLISHGNSVVVIEHNLDIIKVSDFIIDMGPEGGVGGGKLVAAGTPEEVVRKKQSYTGEYLKRALK